MKSKIIFLIAIVLGIVTTILFYNFLGDLEDQKINNSKMVTIVVAGQNIKENQMISNDMLRFMEVPAIGVHPQAIKDQDFVLGKYATCELLLNEPILRNKVRSEKEEKLIVAKKIGDGYRAVSLGVNIVESVSNLIEPEDRVDIVFSEVVKVENEEEIVETQVILENTRVLAVARRMVETTETDVYAEYAQVTLELLPQDAVILINAKERGNIQLVLRSRIIPSAGD